jgi:hypothetical protein
MPAPLRARERIFWRRRIAIRPTQITDDVISTLPSEQMISCDDNETHSRYYLYPISSSSGPSHRCGRAGEFFYFPFVTIFTLLSVAASLTSAMVEYTLTVTLLCVICGGVARRVVGLQPFIDLLSSFIQSPLSAQYSQQHPLRISSASACVIDAVSEQRAPTLMLSSPPYALGKGVLGLSS